MVKVFEIALASLGDATQIGLFLFIVALPKKAKASTNAPTAKGFFSISFQSDVAIMLQW
jgi:hypothetical protein